MKCERNKKKMKVRKQKENEVERNGVKLEFMKERKKG